MAREIRKTRSVTEQDSKGSTVGHSSTFCRIVKYSASLKPALQYFCDKFELLHGLHLLACIGGVLPH